MWLIHGLSFVAMLEYVEVMMVLMKVSPSLKGAGAVS